MKLPPLNHTVRGEREKCTPTPLSTVQPSTQVCRQQRRRALKTSAQSIQACAAECRQGDDFQITQHFIAHFNALRARCGNGGIRNQRQIIAEHRSSDDGFRRKMPFANASSRPNPFFGRIDNLRQIVIYDHTLRQIKIDTFN